MGLDIDSGLPFMFFSFSSSGQMSKVFFQGIFYLHLWYL